MEEEKKEETAVVIVEEKPIFCHKCDAKNSAGSDFCAECGAKLAKDEEDIIRCPKCGSANVEFVTYQASSNFDKGNACCGYLLCGPLGLLCGAKDKTEAKTVRKCKKCGHEF